MIISSMVKVLPNIITFSRILLTFLFVLLQTAQHYHRENSSIYLYILIIFLFICFTDLLDGKIARVLGSTSPMGSFLDVSADAIFIFSSYIALNIFNIIPLWFTIIILIKFLEFIITSYVWRKLNIQSEELFLSDFIGRITAVLFYIIPGVIYILLYKLDYISFYIINIIICITTILALISSAKRLLKLFYLITNNSNTPIERM